MTESLSVERPLIEAVDIVKRYKRHSAEPLLALDGVSLAVHAGEAVGVVGESGSGKSTLSRIMLGLETPTSGEVRLRGRDVATLPRLELRRATQIVFQDPLGSLNRRKTVQQIVASPLRAQGLRRAEAYDRVPGLLEQVGLRGNLLHRRPGELSGGQCQRVGIARSLSVSPDFIVFDESVSAVDASVRAQLMNLIREIQADLGLAFLFVTHDLAVVRSMTTRIAVLRHGRMVEVGSRDALFEDAQDPYTRELLRAMPTLLGRPVRPETSTA